MLALSACPSGDRVTLSVTLPQGRVRVWDDRGLMRRLGQDGLKGQLSSSCLWTGHLWEVVRWGKWSRSVCLCGSLSLFTDPSGSLRMTLLIPGWEPQKLQSLRWIIIWEALIPLLKCTEDYPIWQIQGMTQIIWINRVKSLLSHRYLITMTVISSSHHKPPFLASMQFLWLVHCPGVHSHEL